MKKSSIKAIFLPLVLLLGLTGIGTAVSSSAETNIVPDSNWVVSDENGTTVYTAKLSGTGDVGIISVDKATDANTFSADIRVNKYEFDKNIGLGVISSFGDYFFDYRQDVGAVRFRVNGGFDCISKTYEAAFDEWFNYKLVIRDGNAKCYVNNVLFYDFTNQNIKLGETNEFRISTWGTSSSVKNIKYSKEELPDPGKATDCTSTLWNGYDKKTNADNEIVYDLPTDEAGRRNVYSGSMDFNAIDYDFSFEWGLDGFNTGVYIEGNHRFGLRIEPNTNDVFLKDDTTGVIFKATKFVFTPNKEYHMRLIADSTLFALYIDGNVICYIHDFGSENLTKSSMYYWNWGVKGYVKNFEVSTIDVPNLEKEPEFEPKDPNWPFKPTEFNIEENGGVETYTLLRPGDGITTFNSKLVNEHTFNTWEMDFKFGQPTDSGNQTLWAGFHLAIKNTIAYVIIRRNGVLEASIKGATFENQTFNYDGNEWYHIKFIFADDYFHFYINDTLILESYDTDGMDLENATPGFRTWGMKYAVKNIQTYHQEIEYPSTYKKLDLEFKSEISVSSCDATNATLSWNNGKMVGNVTGSNPSVEVPPITVAPGHKYSMYTPVRNTFLFRLKNNTSASQIKIYYTTTTGGNTVFSKVFDIQPNSDYLTYYFNISDLNSTGYTRSLKFELLNTNSGSFEVDAITFERENPIYPYAGEIVSCLGCPDSKTVSIVGKVDSKYENKKVVIYKSDAGNYNDSLTYKGLVKLAETTVEGGEFTSTFDLYIPGTTTTLLSCYFLVTVDGVKVSPYFEITNYRDFSGVDLDQRFKIDTSFVANVLDYGAKGDGFTDDTVAIQAAIDAVKEHGCGKVLIPGDDSEYGKRYIATHLELCSNLEFFVEENAVIWQSEREEELNKTVPIMQRGFDTVTYGHDVDIDGLVWCHTFATVNKPLIYMYGCENVRINGGGTFRMMDVGNEDDDPYYYHGGVINPVGIDSRVCQIPIAFFYCTNVDFIDFTIMRSSAWHFCTARNNNLYFGNIEEKQACSVTADGFGLSSCTDVIIDRCTTYTSDDGITLSCTVVDDRGFAFYPTYKDNKYKTGNVLVTSSYIWGGFGIVMIPWGTESENTDYTGIKNIEIADSQLGGHKSSGSWPDDPYYGTSYYKTGYSTDGEDFNYVPINDVYYHDNIYFKSFDWSMGKVTPVATNLVVADDVEGTVFSSSSFLNGNFDFKAHKGPGFRDETTWTSGLSYWSYEGNVKSEKIGTKESRYVDTNEPFIQDDYAGVITANGKLYEGLYEVYGAYVLKAKYKAANGNAKFFVRDALTGESYYIKDIEKSSDWTNLEIQFTLPATTTVHIGFEFSGSETDKLYVDDVEIVGIKDSSIYEIDGKSAGIKSTSDVTVYSASSTNIKLAQGVIYTSADNETKIMLNNHEDLEEFEMKVTINVSKGSDINAGVYILANNPKKAADKIDGYNIQIEYANPNSEYTISIFNFSSTDGYLGKVAGSKGIAYDGNPISLRVVVKNKTIFIFVNNEEFPIVTYYAKKATSGMIGLRSQFQSTQFSNFELNYVEVANLSNLLEQIRIAENLDESKYTEASFNDVVSAVENGRLLTKYNTQREVDEATRSIQNAISKLVENKIDDPSTSEPETSEIPSENPSASESVAEPSENPSQGGGSVEEKKGCGGNIVAPISFALIALITLVAIALKKKFN